MTSATAPPPTGDRSRPVQRQAALRTGLTLPYLEVGDPGGVPVVLLHGLSDSARSFEPVLRHLPASIRGLALTQRGHGDAPRPLTGYGSCELAADVVAFLDALGIDRAVVVGHSMGAHVVQCLAARHPERVRAAVLIGAFARLAGHPAAAELDALLGSLVDPVGEAFVEDFQRSTLARPISDELFAAVVQESAKVPARVWQEAWAGLRDTDLADELGGIAAPVHLVWGELDAMADRAMQEELLRAIPDATLHVMPGAGHAPHWEDPAGFAAQLVGFVDAAAAAADARPLDERLFEAAVGTLELFGVYLSARLSLYATLHEHGPLSAEDLAVTAGIDARYAREWCEQQAVAGMLAVADAGAPTSARRYRLPAAHAGALLHPDDPAHVAPFADLLVGIAAALDEVAEAYRTGAGVPYARYGEAFRRGQGGINRPAFGGDLLHWVDAAGLGERLGRPGARIADVGCGQGWSTIALAAAYPQAEVVGYDRDAPSVADGRSAAEAGGSTARFVVADAAAVAQDGPFDVILVLETLHDLAQPVTALRALGAALAPGGAILVADERVAERFTAPGDELERMMYGWSITHCLPACRDEEASAALGTVLREGAVHELARQSGLRATTLDVDAGFFRLYLLEV